MFKHYILTRFNVGYLKKIKNPSQWLNDRIIIFDKYCLNSVLNQSNKNFEWLLLFDKQTPQEILDKYKKFNNIKILPGTSFKKYIMDDQNDNCSHIITTRLDSDDSLHKKAVEEIQKQFKEENFILDFNVYQYDIKNKKLYLGKYYNYTLCPNPYISLIEKNNKKELFTVYYAPHNKMAEYFAYKKIPDFLGLQNIHDSNFTNKIDCKKAKLLEDHDNVIKDYSIIA